jgi:hypothetical protein
MRGTYRGWRKVTAGARAALVGTMLTVLTLTAAGCADRQAPAAGGVPTSPVATGTPAPSASAESPEPTQTSSPTPSPSVDPYALADGAYPAYIRDVSVAERTVTVDVVQTFEGKDAEQAALEDGLAPWKARRYEYYPVYIRNENPLLRTLTVSRHVTIKFMGECEETAHGTSALRELADRALPYSTDWYYTLTMRDDVIERIDQHIAIPAC